MGARLGQHFLSDPRILRRIAAAALLTPDDTVLEIGPGRGTLTRELARHARRVVAIEADRGLAALLTRQSAGTNITVVPGDALRVEWPPADVIAGNIPYQITSPLIERALRAPRPKRVVFLVQREVAGRLAAVPGTRAYGALSAGVQLVAEVERLFDVAAGAFRPPPRVASAVVRITPRAEPLVRDEVEEAATRRLIQVLFQHRRQQIQRSLREMAVGGWRMAADGARVGRLPGNRQPPSAIHDMLRRAGFDPTARPERLSPAEFVALARLAPSV